MTITAASPDDASATTWARARPSAATASSSAPAAIMASHPGDGLGGRGRLARAAHRARLGRHHRVLARGDQHRVDHPHDLVDVARGPLRVIVELDVRVVT